MNLLGQYTSQLNVNGAVWDNIQQCWVYPNTNINTNTTLSGSYTTTVVHDSISQVHNAIMDMHQKYSRLEERMNDLLSFMDFLAIAAPNTFEDYKKHCAVRDKFLTAEEKLK